MNEKKDIVWIGAKLIKKISRGNVDFYFNRLETTATPIQIANELLQYENCFTTPARAKALAKAMDDEHNQNIENEKALKEAALQAEAVQSWLVYFDGEEINISKYSKTQLETINTAECLEIDSSELDTEVGVTTPTEALRIAVREALREKHGTPGLEETTDEQAE